MKSNLVLFGLGIVVCGNLLASDPELVVGCYNVKKQGILHIEARNVAGLGEVSVTYMDGSQEDLQLKEAVDNGLESSIPLPQQGSMTLSLQNRHTGWALTTYDGGYVGHDQIDCQD